MAARPTMNRPIAAVTKRSKFNLPKPTSNLLFRFINGLILYIKVQEILPHIEIEPIG